MVLEQHLVSVLPSIPFVATLDTGPHVLKHSKYLLEQYQPPEKKRGGMRPYLLQVEYEFIINVYTVTLFGYLRSFKHQRRHTGA